jgi:hypothetical protein
VCLHLAEASATPLSPETIREGLMSSHSLGVMELEMPSWTVVSLNDAARCHMTSQFHLILSLNDAARNRLLSRVARDQLTLFNLT